MARIARLQVLVASVTGRWAKSMQNLLSFLVGIVHGKATCTQSQLPDHRHKAVVVHDRIYHHVPFAPHVLRIAGVAGPGGVLAVLPAVQLHDWHQGIFYLLFFSISLTLTMGILVGTYGFLTSEFSFDIKSR